MILRAFMTSMVLLASPATDTDCECAEAGGVFEEYMKYQTIFVGTLDSFGEDRSGHPIATFTVGETFKGEPGKTADVLVKLGMCRYDFDAEGAYIIYASGEAPYNVVASECGRTQKVTDAELTKLRNVSVEMTESEATEAGRAFAEARAIELKRYEHISTTHVEVKNGADYWRVRYGMRPATPGGDFFLFVYSPEHIHYLPGR